MVHLGPKLLIAPAIGGPQPALLIQHVHDYAVWMPTLDIGVHYEHIAAGLVLGYGQDSGKVAFLVFAQGGVYKAKELIGPVAKIYLGLVVIVQPFLHKQAIVRVYRFVLHFTVESALALGYPHNHKVIIGKLFLPHRLCDRQHKGLMHMEEIQGVPFPAIVCKVCIYLCPLLPEGVLLRKGNNRLILDVPIGRVLQGVGKQAVIVQQGADIDNVRVIVPGLGYGFLKPVVELGPLVRGTDIFIILHIVQDNKVGPPVSVLAPTDFLAAADGLQLDVAFGHQHIVAPHLTGQKAKILYNSGVFFKLHPDIVQKALGLFAAV